MATQEAADVQAHGGSDMMALSMKLGEVTVEQGRIEDFQTHAQPLTSLGHVYGHLPGYTNHGDMSDAATNEQDKVVDIEGDDSSHVAVPEKKMRGIKINTRRGRGRGGRGRGNGGRGNGGRGNGGRGNGGRGNGKWVKRDLTDAEKEERDRITKMVLDHFRTYYAHDDLASWQAISRDLGVKIGATIAECKQILKDIFINIVDFVEACNQDKLSGYFETGHELAVYIKRHHPNKTFPLDRAEEVLILKWMLIDVALERRLHRG